MCIFPQSLRESQRCCLIPLSYLLSCSSTQSCCSFCLVILFNGISGPSFHFLFPVLVLFFCLVLLLILSRHFSASGPFWPFFFLSGIFCEEKCHTAHVKHLGHDGRWYVQVCHVALLLAIKLFYFCCSLLPFVSILFLRFLFNMVSASQTEWSVVPANVFVIYAFLTRAILTGLTPQKCVGCLCMYVLFYVCTWTDFVDLTLEWVSLWLEFWNAHLLMTAEFGPVRLAGQ